MPPVRDVLVVADDVARVLDHLARPVTVVQHLPPRVAVVRAGDDALPGLRSAPGMWAVGDPDLPADLRGRLDEVERLFVDAWVQGRRPKARRGEGLAWDAAGFLPPDPPPRGTGGP